MRRVTEFFLFLLPLNNKKEEEEYKKNHYLSEFKNVQYF